MRARQVLRVSGLTYTTRSGVKVTVTEREMRSMMEELATCNGWSLQDQLANEAVPADQPLDCLLVSKLPLGWRKDSSGYLMVRFKDASTTRGSSFLGDGDDPEDKTFKPRNAGGKRKASALAGGSAETEGAPPTPSRVSGRERTQAGTYSQSSPRREAQVGRSQRLLERYHRVAFAACVPGQQLQDGWVLHACGNKNCAKVAHYYLGDEATNALDTSYHRAKPDMSRTCLPRLQ